MTIQQLTAKFENENNCSGAVNFHRAPMHFCPITFHAWLCRAVPDLSIGAAAQYVWSAAFAYSPEAWKLAFNNLIGLLPVNFCEGVIVWEEEA
jgi:hypothetical protein